eukprot:3182111-Pyramimonas_sp.AAC.1
MGQVSTLLRLRKFENAHTFTFNLNQFSSERIQVELHNDLEGARALIISIAIDSTTPLLHSCMRLG